MERLKRILKRVFFLPAIPTILIAVPVFAVTFYLLYIEADGVAAYIAYFASAYALVISITAAPDIVRSVSQGVRNSFLMKKLRNIPLANRFLEDVRFRTEVSLYQGFFINLLYIAMKMATGIYYRSAWFISIAVYYALLALMRVMLLLRGAKKTGRKHMEEELHRYRLCGIMLFLLNQALAGMVIFMVHQNRGFDYPGLLIYLMALYSFYSVIIAVINLIKFRKHKSPVLSAAKVISFVAAMVSILSLETAMLARFGGDDEALRAIMTEISGGGICSIVIFMAVFMVAKSTRELKRLKFNEAET